MDILLSQTDETHRMTMEQIISALATYGIHAERKSIYDDIEQLGLYGLDIVREKENRTCYYKVVNRTFELAELKLLVDSVQASRFITTKKSRELIKKIEGLASSYEAAQLQRQVYVSERVKTINENIYYNVDQIHMAISSKCQITFQYYNWDVSKRQVLKRNGERYQVSPWALSWDNENYYLVAFDSVEDKIKHFRVDKMLHIKVEKMRRVGERRFQEFDMGAYSNKLFGMFDGEEEIVKILCENQLAGVMIDRFGKQVQLIKVDEEHFYVNVKVAVSRQFLAWVMALGEGAKIIAPESVVKKVHEEVERLVRQYKEQ